MVLYTNNGEGSNLTEDEDFYTAAIYTLLVLSLLIALQNLLVVASISVFTPKSYSFSPFICSIAIVDVLRLFGPVSLSLHIYISRESFGSNVLQGRQNSALCKAQSWLITFLRISSTLSILLLSIDRTVSLAAQDFYLKKWKGRALVVVVMAYWILSALVASWPLSFEVSESKPLQFSPKIFCLFTTNSVYSLSFASIHLVSASVSACCIFYATSSSKQSLFRASYSSSTGKMALHKTRHLIHVQYHQKVSRMVALVIVVYSICLLPWLVSLFLDYFSIPYPQIYGLLSFQLPMVSGLCNPSMYALIWPPFRRAYRKTLAAPLRMCRKASDSQRPRDIEDSSRSYNFWTTDRMTDDQQVSTINRLIDSSPNSHDPIDLMPDELRMFENDGLTTDSISIDMNSPKLNKMSSFKGTTESIDTTTTVLDASGQFQSILDLIEEMTDGKTKAKFSTSQASLKRSRSKVLGSNASSIDRSAVTDKEHALFYKANYCDVNIIDHAPNGRSDPRVHLSAVKLKGYAPNDNRPNERKKGKSALEQKGHALNGKITKGRSFNSIDRSVRKHKEHALNGDMPKLDYNLNSMDRSVVKFKAQASIPKKSVSISNVDQIDGSLVFKDKRHAPKTRSFSVVDDFDESLIRFKGHSQNDPNSFNGPLTAGTLHEPPAELSHSNAYLATMEEEEEGGGGGDGGLNSCINSNVSSCVRLGKSKCYKLEKRYLDYLVQDVEFVQTRSDSNPVFSDV